MSGRGARITVYRPAVVGLSQFGLARPLPDGLIDRAEQARDRFDSETMFFDVFRSASGDSIICLGPPLEGCIPGGLVPRVSDGSDAPAFDQHLQPSRIPEQLTWRLTVSTPNDHRDTLRLDAAGKAADIAVRESHANLLAGRRVLLTLCKDYPLRWIIDWATFHVRLHGADAVLFYDNGSTSYTLDELAASLGEIGGLREVVVVDWPFPYGVGGPPGVQALDNFCQTGALDHARRCFCADSRSVLSLDVDELLPTADRSIFGRVERSSHAVMPFFGIWTEAPGVGKPEDLDRIRHRDCSLAWRSQLMDFSQGKVDGLCRTKWVAVPARCGHDVEWGIHDVYPATPQAHGTQRQWRSVDRSVAYRHFRQINTGWKSDRWRSSVDTDQVCTPDAEIAAAFLRAFGEDPPEGAVSGLPKNGMSDPELVEALATAEEERRAFLALCLEYDRVVGELTRSRSWRASRLLSAAWIRLPAPARRAVLATGRRVWRSPLLARFRAAAMDEHEIDELREHLFSRLLPGAATTAMWTGNSPRVSVVSPLYRSRDSVEPFLIALRDQDYGGEIEVILVDDMSPDMSGDVAERVASTAAGRLSVNVIRNAENLGNCGSRNRGIGVASGDFVIVIDPDCIVNPRFVRSHVHQHLKGFDVVLGPMGIESGGADAQDIVKTLEGLGPAAIAARMRLQDRSAPASGVNCVTRNFSISRKMLERFGRPLFDERYAYRNTKDTGFGWEDVEMGASLRRAGARIAFSWDAFSVHMSHGSAVDEQVRARGSAKNFIRLIEEHPQLLKEAPEWAETTAARIARWQGSYERPDRRLSGIAGSGRANAQADQGTDIVVYSAIAGGYDRIRTPRKGIAERHVLFTDAAGPAPGWETRRFDRIAEDPVRTAKAPKVLAHRYAGGTEWSVWIDGNVELVAPAGNLIAEVERSGCSIGLFRHPERYCAYDEGAACIKRGKDAAERIAEQLSRYEAEGYPRRFGLAECNVIVRRHNDPAVSQAMEIWWEEIEKGSRRDQISFNYALWRAGMAYHELGNGLVDVRSDRRFVYHRHG